MLGAELENQPVGLLFDRGDDKLHDVAGLVFEFNRQVFVPKNGGSVLKRFQQFSRRDAVIEVFADPGLKKAGDQPAHSAAAIDKILLHATDFSDVEMRLDWLTVSPDDGQR